MKTATNFTRLCLGLLISSSSLLFTNCKKDDKDPEEEPVVTPAPTNTQKLTGKNYKMTALTVEPAILGVSDLYAQMADCEKDNLIRFDTPNVYKEDEGATKCNTGDVQTETGTWVWNTDETVITTTMNGNVASWNVLTNDGTTLKVKRTESLNGVNYTMTSTFAKQ